MKISYLIIFVGLCFFFTNLVASPKEELAEQLKEMGYDVLKVSNSGDNALHLATKKLNLVAIKLAVEYGMSISRTNKAGDSPLHLAASKGNLPICEYLLSQGADMNQANILGQTAYHKALGKPNCDLLSLFESNGYNSHDPFKDYLIASGLNPDSVDNSGNQLMHRLSKTKNLELMHKALESGYSPDVLNKKGETPLTLAIKNQDLEMAKLLNEYGNQITMNDIFALVKLNWLEGLTLLESYPQEHVQSLLNEHNEKGIAPIHYACVMGDFNVLNYLVQLGANVNLLTLFEYEYGPQDPVYWNSYDWDTFAEFGNLGDLQRYKQDSGYIHPVVSPLAIINYFHPTKADLTALFINAGAKYVYHDSIRDHMLEEYLK